MPLVDTEVKSGGLIVIMRAKTIQNCPEGETFELVNEGKETKNA